MKESKAKAPIILFMVLLIALITWYSKSQVIYSNYTVMPGDTLESIAEQSNMIDAKWRIVNRNYICDGVYYKQKLEIPRRIFWGMEEWEK